MKFSYTIGGNKRIHLYKIIFIILIVIANINLFVLKTYGAADLTERDSTGTNPKISIEYIKDTKGNLTLEQVKSDKFKNSFKNHKGSTVSIGFSKDTWWFRIKVKDLYDSSKKSYFSSNNANIEKITLYLPQTVNGQETYYTMKAGWGFKNKTDDIGFIYPVFEIPKGTNIDGYMYIQSKSLYTHNYEFKIIYDEQFDELRQVSLLCIGIVFGILIAMLLYNFMLFMFLRDRVYLYYVIYMFIMIIYQLGIIGAIRIFKWKQAYLLEQYLEISGTFMMISIIVFIRTFLRTDKNVPWQDKFLKTSVGFLIGNIFIMILGYKYIAVFSSSIISNFVLILVLSVSISCLCKGVRQARYFLLAWSILIIGATFFVIRGFGVIPQNFFTVNILLISAAIESILISVALADRIKIMREEKENVLVLFENAKKSSKSHEIAFLQAQIKPHFLYNALNVIATLCRIDSEKARELILDLSNYLHHTFDFNNTLKYITFEEELEFVEAYVRIEKARFRDKLKVEYEIENTRELMLPPLILQPLVENAIKHGIRKNEQGGIVILRVKNDEKCFIIEVEDNGIGMDSEDLEKIQKTTFETGKGIGLVNINLRLKEIYGTGLNIESEIGIGTLVSFKIPKNLSFSEISIKGKIKKRRY